jgi:rhodanese-related sulfurtransferase
MQHGYVYLDVRTVAEFDTGHPAGAYNVPLLLSEGVVNERFVDEVQRALGKPQKLVVSCASGVRSVQASALLCAAGFSHVVEQRAGMDGVRDAFGRVKEKGHRAEQLPVAMRAEVGRSYAELQRG